MQTRSTVTFPVGASTVTVMPLDLYSASIALASASISGAASSNWATTGRRESTFFSMITSICSQNRPILAVIASFRSWRIFLASHFDMKRRSELAL